MSLLRLQHSALNQSPFHDDSIRLDLVDGIRICFKQVFTQHDEIRKFASRLSKRAKSLPERFN